MKTEEKKQLNTRTTAVVEWVNNGIQVMWIEGKGNVFVLIRQSAVTLYTKNVVPISIVRNSFKNNNFDLFL